MDTYVKRPQCYNGQRVRFLIPDFRLGQTYVFVSIAGWFLVHVMGS